MFSKVFIYSVRPLPTFLCDLNLESIFGNDRLCDSWFFLMDYSWKHYFCSHIMRKAKRKHNENRCFFISKIYILQINLSSSSLPFFCPLHLPSSCPQSSPHGVMPLLESQQNQWENGIATQSSLIV